jgi:hypothetical protein
MDKKIIGIGALAVLVAVTLWLLVGGLSEAPAPGAGGTAGGAAHDGTKDEAGASGSSKAPVVKREELSAEAAKANDPNLALPTNLPALRNVQPAANGNLPAVPTQPHGQFELEGDVQEQDAEAAVRALFPPIRDCYAELRQRAPQAKGRMLMKFAVKPATDAGQAATGELFLKETQFTDPKYLTCVRTAIDSTKFPVGKNVNGSVTVPLFLSPQDAGEAP